MAMKKLSDEDLASIFKALGDLTRLKIVKSIRASGNNMCVTAIADKLAVSQPMISQHLKILKNAGIVSAQRIGYHIHYRVNVRLIMDFIAANKSLYAKAVGRCKKEKCLKKSQ